MISTGQRPPPEAMRLASKETHSSAKTRNSSLSDLTSYPYTTRRVRPPAYLMDDSSAGSQREGGREEQQRGEGNIPPDVAEVVERVGEEALEELLGHDLEEGMVGADGVHAKGAVH